MTSGFRTGRESESKVLPNLPTEIENFPTSSITRRNDMDNLATVKTIYEAFGKGDIPTILEWLADDVHWDEWNDNFAQRAGVPWLQARSGKSGALEFFQFVGGNLRVTDFQVLSF